MNSLQFQQIDIDFYTQNNQAIIRIYGRTEYGKSVLLHVHGFYHYFYIRAPKNSTIEFEQFLNQNLKSEYCTEPVRQVEIVQKVSLYGYCKKDCFLKITTAHPYVVKKAARVIQNSIYGPEIYECNIDFQTRFMVDTNIVGCNWIELPASQFTYRHTKTSSCDIECDVHYKNIISYSPELKQSVAPFKILSFDIEVAGRKGIFPEPEIDPVIQIASVISVQGQIDEQYIVFTVNTCDDIENVTLKCFETEYQLLLEWSKFVKETDPDIIIGYNIKNFDVNYLICRAKTLKCAQFLYLGRINYIASKTVEKKQQSKQTGCRNSKETNINGRCQLDLYQIITRDYKLRSYSLNSVSKHFLKEQKDDVHYTEINDLYFGDSTSRQKLAKYCLKDAILPLRLMNKLMIFINYMEMARVTGVSMQTLFVRGQQIKIVSQLLRQCKAKQYIIPTMQVNQIEQYEGALVIEPKKGFYDEPIVTLDFASLYPSIMMAHNLCYTTLLTVEQAQAMSEDDYVKTPSGSLFVKKHVRKGLLPEILENLLAARQKAKNDLKAESDAFKKSVLDGRQLALKISANSVYGFTGAQIGYLPCLQISASVTAFGREMIIQTKNEIESKYNINNNCSENAVVVYGDTDSVMIKFGIKSMDDAIKFGKEAATFVSQKFISPIKLEFEKVYYPFLLINKKKYAGLLYTKTDVYDKMDCKGIETVRREYCPLVATIANECLHKILIERNPSGAIEYSKKTISDLKSNQIDISQLVITREIRKSEYKVKQPHVELAKKIESREPGTGPRLGDRVQYVVIASEKKKLYERVEDPQFVIQNNIPLDIKYYVKQQIAKPIKRIFEVIVGEAKANEIFEENKYKTMYSYFKRQKK